MNGTNFYIGNGLPAVRVFFVPLRFTSWILFLPRHREIPEINKKGCTWRAYDIFH